MDDKVPGEQLTLARRNKVSPEKGAESIVSVRELAPVAETPEYVAPLVRLVQPEMPLSEDCQLMLAFASITKGKVVLAPSQMFTVAGGWVVTLKLEQAWPKEINGKPSKVNMKQKHASSKRDRFDL
jgi:hypothetical protein